MSLGTAAAISGAAASPLMGSKTPSAAQTLLLSLMSVRLGFWAPTPSGKRWNEPHPRLWPFYLLRETLANTGKIGTYCYLTDGGHFDNTGIYSLIERGCRYIVACDCGADPRPGFEDMGSVIRRCRIDFGCEIVLGIDGFGRPESSGATVHINIDSGAAPMPSPPGEDRHVVRGTIRYHDAHLKMLGIEPRDDTRNGVILWVKPIVRPGDTADVRQYKIAHPQFPQQSTSDQWYDESQFESYRKLGYDSIREYFPSASAGFPQPGDYQRLAEFFNE